MTKVGGRSSRSGEPRRHTRDDENGHERGGKNWMSASPMAWVSGALSVVSLATVLYNGVISYAGVHADVKTAQADIARNFREDEKRNDHMQKMIEKNHDYAVKAVERIDTTISTLGAINVKIGVLETKLESLVDILKRMERQLERSDRNASKPDGKPHK